MNDAHSAHPALLAHDTTLTATDSHGPATDEVLLRNGRIARLRVVQQGDRDALIELHTRMSPRSRYLRFFGLGDHNAEGYVDLLLQDVAEGQAFALVAISGGAIVAVGSWFGLASATGEIAFAVADEAHGQGLGTLLLERLADAAQQRGLTHFVAEVLAENDAMLDVLLHSGFEVELTRRHGEMEVRIPVHLTERLLEAISVREESADALSLRALLSPSSVAVVGASRNTSSPGHTVVANLLQDGFVGPVYPVNPAANEILGRRAYPTIEAIEKPIDLAVVAVPARSVQDVVGQCARAGVRGLVILSSGFAEAGPEGLLLQNAVLRTARSSDMRVVGPNCLGIANTNPAVRLNATFLPTPVRPGSVALMTQSGAVGIAALERAAELGLGLSAFVSVGNKADVSGNDLLMLWDADERTRVIALYLESFGNPRKFSRIARRIARTKPIVALIGGSSSVGRRAAAGHTSAAVTSSKAVDALFRQCGVIRATSLEQLLRVSTLLAHQPLPHGANVAIISNGGGPGILAADSCAEAGIQIGNLSARTEAAIKRQVPGAASAVNPVDLGSGATGQDFAASLQTLSQDDGVDVIIAVHTPVPSLDDDQFAAALAKIADDLARTTTVAVMLGSRNRPIEGTSTRIPVLPFPEDAARALAPVLDHVRWRTEERGAAPVLDRIDRAAAQRLAAERLAEHPRGCRLGADDAQALLSLYGIDVVPSRTATTAREAVAAAHAIGYPAVLKTADPEIVHKTDMGGVRLGLTTDADVRAAFHEVDATSGSGVIVQPQLRPGLELIVGVTQDEIFGPLVLFGMGGTATELVADRVLRLTPLTSRDAATAVRSLRCSPLLFGYRGAPKLDVRALEELLLRLGRLADDVPQISEIDLNPVLALPDGAAIVDAKVRLDPVNDRTSPLLSGLRPPVSLPRGTAG